MDSESDPSTDRQERLGSTAAFGLALQEATGESRRSEHVEESDETVDGVDASAAVEDDSEYGPAIAPLRPRKIVASDSKESSRSTAQQPLSKRWRKWYKRSWLSNPSTAGWQIAAGYAGIGVLVLVTLLAIWLQQLRSQAKEDTHTSYATVEKESVSNVTRLVLTGMFSVGTLVCLPIPYWLWIGSSLGRWLWLFVRGAFYLGGLMILHSELSGSPGALAIGLTAILGVAAVGNLVGCFLLTTWEGSVGRTLFAILLIVFGELAAIGVYLAAAGSTSAQTSVNVPGS